MNNKFLGGLGLAAISMIAVATVSCTDKKEDVLAFSKSSYSVSMYGTVELELNKEGTIAWSVSDESVATVENGVLTALKTGTVTVTAILGDEQATCTVTISEATIAGYEVTADPSSFTSLAIGGTEEITLTAKVLTETVTPSHVFVEVEDAAIATAVVEEGKIKVTGVAKGNTQLKITAWYQGAKSEITVPVAVIYDGVIELDSDFVTLSLEDTEDMSKTYIT